MASCAGCSDRAPGDPLLLRQDSLVVLTGDEAAAAPERGTHRHRAQSVIAFREHLVKEAQPDWGIFDDSDCEGHDSLRHTRWKVQSVPDHHAARNHRSPPLMRWSVVRVATKKRPAPKSACSRTGRQFRPVATTRPAAGAMEPVQHAHRTGRAFPRVPDLELDRARCGNYIARENIELPSIYYQASARSD